MPLGNGEILVGMIEGALFRWSEADGLRGVTTTPVVALSHGVEDDVNGDWWFVTRFGELYRGTFDSDTSIQLTFVTRSRAFATSGRHRMVLRYENDEPTIYTIRSAGLFERYTESGAATLHEFSTADFGSNIVRTPNGEVVAAASGDTIVAVRRPDGTVDLEDVGAAAGFTAANYVEGMGVVLGSSDGRFWMRTDAGDWSEVGRSPLTVFPYALTGFEGGFFFGGAFGAGGQYLPDGYCAVQDQLAAFTIQHTVLVPGGIFAVGQNPNRPETPGQLVRYSR